MLLVSTRNGVSLSTMNAQNTENTEKWRAKQLPARTQQKKDKNYMALKLNRQRAPLRGIAYEM